ncbi:MAG: gliding motility-associated-like protein, partial [Maribacter sp.]
NYEWEGPNGFNSVNQNPSITSATLLNAGTYTVIVTDASGCINIATTDVVVNDLPTPTAVNDSPVCFGGNVNLIATGGTNYEWEGPDGFTSTSQSPSLINTTLLANGTYTVIVTDGNSCTATAETIVTIYPLPNSGAFSNGPICNGDILTLTGTGGISYEWEGPDGFAMSGAAAIVNPVTLLSAGIYTVTVTDINGCTNVSTTNVIVNELPIVTANSNSPVCVNETIILNADGGVSYEWEGPDSFSSTDQSPSIPLVALNNGGVYTVTVTDANGCLNTNTTTVIINELPIVLANNDSPVCPGFDVQLTASGGDSYVWSSSTGFSSNEQNPLLSNADINDNGVYTVTATYNNGCTSTASTNVQVFNTVVQVASNNSPICLGETAQLSVTGDPNWTYEWSNSNGYNATGQNPSFEGDEVSDSGTYSVTITDNNGCEGVFNTIVVISDFPSIMTETSGPACEFASVQLITTYNPIWNYEWEGPNNFIDSISDPILENVTEINEGYYYVSVTNATGCETIDTIFLDVYDDLMAVPYGDTIIYETQSTIIGVSDGVNVIWNPTNTLNCSDCLDVVAMPEETTVYQVVVSDEYGCLDTFNITVEVEVREEDDLIVPNTITPNDDGKNDTWVIPWLDQFPDNEVVILNRWGDEVFKAKSYQNNFGGKYNGRDLPPGTYYFILLLGEDFTPFKGPLTIIRD